MNPFVKMKEKCITSNNESESPTHERSSQKYHLHNYLNHSAIVQHYLTPFKKSARFASETESPSKVMKNPFYFILKALLVLKIFKILFDFLVR